MLQKTLIIFGLLLLMSLSALAAEAIYSTVIEDLPLMPGMTEKADDAVVFDKPAGRILETTAEIAATPEEIKAFYAETLPSLGWQAHAGSAFVREDETLQLDIEKIGDATLVHFSLTPHHKGE